jgi:hypothetical protein
MPSSKLNIADSESVNRFTNSRSADDRDDVLAINVRAKEAQEKGWDNIVDNKLIEWAVTRKDFELEGLLGPSCEAISCAYELVNQMRKNLWPLPTGVIPDGEGGIVFENRQDPIYQRIEIDQGGRAYLATFDDFQLMDRVSINFE